MYGGSGGGDGNMERNLLMSRVGSSKVDILSAFSSSCDSEASSSGVLILGISFNQRANCLPR